MEVAEALMGARVLGDEEVVASRPRVCVGIWVQFREQAGPGGSQCSPGSRWPSPQAATMSCWEW
jgi:hypothetical protein